MAEDYLEQRAGTELSLDQLVADLGEPDGVDDVAQMLGAPDKSSPPRAVTYIVGGGFWTGTVVLRAELDGEGRVTRTSFESLGD